METVSLIHLLMFHCSGLSRCVLFERQHIKMLECILEIYGETLSNATQISAHRQDRSGKSTPSFYVRFFVLIFFC